MEFREETGTRDIYVKAVSTQVVVKAMVSDEAPEEGVIEEV